MTTSEANRGAPASTVPNLPALARASALPGALAVSAPDESLSYDQLLSRADRAAAALRGLGVGDGSLIGLCLPRSAALVVASLGIATAGATAVALDPAYPPRRLRDLLADSGARWVITTPDGLPGVGSAAATLPGVGTVVALDQSSALDQVPGLGLERPPRTEPGLACVVYTSGSTGAPKGVMVERAGMANLARWHRRAFAVGPSDRCSQVAGPGFDAAAWELWGALSAGASLHVAPEELKTDPVGLRDWLVAEGVTVSFLPTPLAEAVLALDWPVDTALRVLLTGGDRLRATPRAGLPFAVVNNYGVTEASVVSTSGVVGAGTPGAPSIGRPVDGVDCLVVDGELRPVPAGTAGELLLGGVSLARGYLHAPELSAQRFVALPAAAGRWYRTGDVVRVRPDGVLDFVNRLDDQVQVRGHRVEPAEIEAALDRHPSVLRSVVTSAGEGAAGLHLVAYLQPVGEHQAGAAELRAHLAACLPAHMVPAAFRWVGPLPVTPNGKIDRAALPASAAAPGDRPEPAADDDDDDLEATVVALLAELLHVDAVAPDDNFLLLGGHSLLGAQLVTRLADQFGVEMSLRSLFDHPTAAGISTEVRRLLVQEVLALDDVTAARLTEQLAASGDQA